MTDPLSPTPLSEEERLHFTNLREAWRRAAPVYTDIAATDVEWLCTLIDRLSPGVAEPPAEDRDDARDEWWLALIHRAEEFCRAAIGEDDPWNVVQLLPGLLDEEYDRCPHDEDDSTTGGLCDGCGLPRPEPPPVAEGVVLLDGKQRRVEWVTTEPEGPGEGPRRTPHLVEVPMLPDPQEAEAFPPDPPEENP